MSGSSNLKSDDFDMDIGVDHSLDEYPSYDDYNAFSTWVCPGTRLDANVAFRHFSKAEFDAHTRSVAMISSNRTSASVDVDDSVERRCENVHYLSTYCDVEPGRQDTPPATFCRAEYEGLEVLINLQWNNGDEQHRDKLRDEFGASYWVPLESGGKNTGLHFDRYFKPVDGEGWSSLFAWPEWLEALNRGYKSMSRDDDEITMTEFVSYVVEHPKLNELWLRRVAVEEPCVIANAQIHANHTLFFSSFGLMLRAACPMACGWRDDCEHDHPDAWQCQKKQYEVFGSRWQSISYLSSPAECATAIRDLAGRWQR